MPDRLKQTMVMAVALLITTLVWAPGASAQVSTQATEVGACTNCPNCQFSYSKHKGPSGGTDGSGLHEACLPMAGCAGHPACGGAALGPAELRRHDELLGLIDEVALGATEAVQTLFSDFGDLAHLDMERTAIQVDSDCPLSDAVIAHIRLTDRQLALANRLAPGTVLASLEGR